MAPHLLKYALEGEPSAPSKKSAKALWPLYPPRLRRLLKSFGIHPLESEETKISRLTYHFNSNLSARLDQLGFASRKEAILEAIHGCTSWNQLQTMVSILSSTEEGCAFLAENSERVVNGIGNCRYRHKNDDGNPRGIPVDRILKFLNNLNLKMGSRGFRIGAHLCNAGLYYAAKVGAIPAVKMYLTMSQEAMYPINRHTELALFHLSMLLRDELTGSKVLTPWGPHSDTVRLLLMGWSQDNGLSSENERQSCFVDLLSHERGATFDRTRSETGEIGLHSRYLLVLGELGYNQTLFHDWQRMGDPELPNVESQSLTHTGNLRSQHVSAMAFLLAKNQSRALSILETIPRASEDSEIIKLSKSDRAMSFNVFSSHYSFHKLRNRLNTYRGRKEPFPSDPEQALYSIDRLLVDGYFGDATGREVVKWGTVDGKEGLLVMDGDEQKYFKPAKV
jgi:hypothetical protein